MYLHMCESLFLFAIHQYSLGKTNRPNGITFIAGPTTTVLASKWNLKPGDIVTFKHRGFWIGSNKPKSPTIYRVRQDRTWEDVVASFDAQKHTPTGL
jgi:hypothetical protein